MTREERKQWYYEQTHKIIDNIIHKQCTVCKEWCPDTEEYFYWRNKNKPEKGFQSECKKCSSNTNNNRQKANYDKYKEYRAEWIEKVIIKKMLIIQQDNGGKKIKSGNKNIN